MKLDSTPGPWILDTGVIYAQCQLGKDGMTSESPLAEITTCGERDDDYEANARLIAAAPSMIEALIDAAKFWDDVKYDVVTWKEDDGTEEGCYEEDNKYGGELDHLKSIIEAATGKTWEELNA